MASSPFEIQLGPADVYRAPLGESFPAVEDAPAGNWELIADAEHITEDGIVIRGNPDITLVRSLGTIAAVKAGMVARDFQLEFTVMDTRVEAQAVAYGADPDDAVTDTPAGGGAAGFRQVDVPIDPVPQGFALLLRWDQSGYGDGYKSQYQIYSAVQLGDGNGIFSKSTPFGQRHLWTALNSSAGFVRLVEQDAAVSP
jgi:hypothetical protein